MMENVERFFGFLSAYRIFVATVGFLLGVLIFFESTSLITLLGAGLILSLISVSFLLLVQSAWKKNFRVMYNSVMVLLILVGLAAAFYFWLGVSGGAIVTTVKYNPFQGECEKVGYGSFDGLPWYYSSCQGEKLQKYCSDQIEEENNSQVRVCMETKGLYTSSDLEFR